MNKLYCLIVLCLCSITIAHAQTDSCADITRDTDKVQNIITLSSPSMQLTVRNVITKGIPEVSIIFSTNEMAASDEAGLYILLENGKRMKYFGQHVVRTWVNARDGYSYEATMPCSQTLLETFKKQRVTMFQIAGIDASVNEAIGEQFRQYVNCIGK